jgi:uncharacterized RmlC-like cupin family protein
MMKGLDISPAEMEHNVARFKDLSPSKKSFKVDNTGIPGEAYELIAAHSVYSVMAPEGNTRKAAKPGVIGAPGLEVAIAECPQGNGPALHNHQRTVETFMCLSGKYEIIWGNDGEHSVVLEPFDLCSIPPGVYRRFKNISALDDAKLLVLVQGKVEDTFGDVAFDPKIATEVERRWGAKVVENFKNIGITFAEDKA